MNRWMRWTLVAAGLGLAGLLTGAVSLKVLGREPADVARGCRSGGTSALQLRSSDGLCLQAYAWEAEQPRAALLLVHGLQDHALRHEALAKLLQQRGVSVLAYDQRGHGLSGGVPQRIDSTAQALADLRLLLAELQRRHPGLPLYVHGHSFGGLQVAHLLQQPDAPKLAGAVMSSAALQRPAAVSEGAERLLTRLAGWAPNLGLEALQPERLLREPAAQATLRADPRVSQAKLPLRTVVTLLQSVANLPRQPQPVPQLLLHGEADTVTPPQGSQAWAAQQPQAQLQLYPGARHDLQNEPEGSALRERVAAFVLTQR